MKELYIPVLTVSLLEWCCESIQKFLYIRSKKDIQPQTPFEMWQREIETTPWKAKCLYKYKANAEQYILRLNLVKEKCDGLFYVCMLQAHY